MVPITFLSLLLACEGVDLLLCFSMSSFLGAEAQGQLNLYVFTVCYVYSVSIEMAY